MPFNTLGTTKTSMPSPPQNLLQRVLGKVRESKNIRMTLIAPLHTKAIWFPDLLDLLIARPIELPRVEDLLTEPISGRPHKNLRGLNLHAWRLSEESCLRLAFRNNISRQLPTPSDPPQSDCKQPDGKSSWICAIQGTSILSRRMSLTSQNS